MLGYTFRLGIDGIGIVIGIMIGIGTDIVLNTETLGYKSHCDDGFLAESWVEAPGELGRRCLDLSNYPEGSGARQQNPWIDEHQSMTQECEMSCDQNASCSIEQFSPVCLCDEASWAMA